MRTVIRPRTLLALAGLALTPALGGSQEATRTHTVKAGDTLWDIAQLYLGDPFKWPEIYRLNTDKVKDPHWIYPDQLLVISGTPMATPGTPADAVVVTDTTALVPMPVPTPSPTDTANPMGQPQPAASFQQGAPRPMTIFNPARFEVVRAERQTLTLEKPAQAVRSGEYSRAPFLWDASGLSNAGKVGSAVAVDAIGTGRLDRPIQMFERVYLDIPSASSGAAEERFISFRYGPTIVGEGRVVVPTGVFKITKTAIAGRAEAILLTQFESVLAGHGLIPLDTLVMPVGTNPALVEFGLKTTLVWMDGEPVIVSTGQQVIIAAGGPEGLVPGDQITLQRDLGNDVAGRPLPPDDVAVVRVTRVTNWGASAIIIGQSDGGIAMGMTGRVTAKMP